MHPNSIWKYERGEGKPHAAVLRMFDLLCEKEGVRFDEYTTASADRGEAMKIVLAEKVSAATLAVFAAEPGWEVLTHDRLPNGLADALADAGFVQEAPALISWLGVTQYLSPDSVSNTLRWAAGCAPGSEIILTFVAPGPEAEAEKALLAAHLKVDFATFFTPDQMTGLLREVGFRQIEHFAAEQVNKVYFRGRSDGLRAPTMERLVSATVV